MIINPKDMENYNFNSVGDEIGNAYDEGYKQGSQETAKDFYEFTKAWFGEDEDNDYFEELKIKAMGYGLNIKEN